MGRVADRDLRGPRESPSVVVWAVP